MTRIVHDETALARAEQASRVLFGGEVTGLSAGEIRDIFADVPSSEVPKQEFEAGGIAIVDLLQRTGLSTSKGDARRLITGGGIYVNNGQINDTERAMSLADTIEGRFLVLRKGKKNYYLLQLIE